MGGHSEKKLNVNVEPCTKILQINDSLLGVIDSGYYVGFKLSRRSVVVELNWIGRVRG